MNSITGTAVAYPIWYGMDAPGAGSVMTLRQVLEGNPSLTPSGYRWGRDANRYDWWARTPQRTFELQFDDACRVLMSAERVKVPTVGSYGLKHVVERLVHNYISNGAVICAALALGFSVKPGGEPNALIGVSRKTLRAWYAGAQEHRWVDRSDRLASWDYPPVSKAHLP